MINTKELFRPLLAHRRQEKKKRVSLEIGEGVQKLVQSGRITPDQGWSAIEGTKAYADSYQVRIGYRKSQVLYTAEVQRLTNHSRRRPR